MGGGWNQNVESEMFPSNKYLVKNKPNPLSGKLCPLFEQLRVTSFHESSPRVQNTEGSVGISFKYQGL